MIHTKCKALFSLKNKKKIYIYILVFSAVVVISALRVNLSEIMFY